MNSSVEELQKALEALYLIRVECKLNYNYLI